MGIYLPSGYLDIERIDQYNCAFNILVGGRGIGKTYGLLQYYLKRGERIIYMRRTAEQTRIAGTVAFSPYKKVCEDMGIEFDVVKGAVKTVQVNDNIVAYMLSLSTFSNTRGVDGSDCKAIVYDEFIPEKQERPIRDEANSLWNAFETINRNRELSGEPPLKLWMVSNSNNLRSPILADLGLLTKVLRMEENGIEIQKLPERNLLLVHCQNSPISQAKSSTVLYGLVNDSFKKMALGNSYQEDTTKIKSRPLQDYRPICGLGEVYIYKHKSEGTYYLSSHKSGNPQVYGTGETDIIRFLRRYGPIVDMYQLGYCDSESVEIDYVFRQLLNL